MITDNYAVFCDKYHNKQHISDDLIQYILSINTETIALEKLKKEHQKKLIFGYRGINGLCKRLKISHSEYYGTIIQNFQRVRIKEKNWTEDNKYLGQEFTGYFYSTN
tara:strand:- start:1513 stop:1833 length:321 start_codon:yes stop_codon:yes gene_type:complete